MTLVFCCLSSHAWQRQVRAIVQDMVDAIVIMVVGGAALNDDDDDDD